MNNRTRKIFDKLKRSDYTDQDATFICNDRRPSALRLGEGSLTSARLGDFDSDDSVADRNYIPSPSSSDSDTGYGAEINKVKRVLFKDDDNLITLQDIIDVNENVASSYCHQSNTLNDQVECQSLELLVESTNQCDNQALNSVTGNIETFDSPICTTRPTAESSTKKAPKKRIRKQESWQKNIVKKARLEGKAYQSKVAKERKEVEARSLKPPCKCRAKCFEKICEEDRQRIFNSFWSNCNSWEQRRQFVADRVTKTVKVRTRVSSSFEADKRKYNFNYSLELQDNIISVCKVMFLNTLSIGEKYVKITVDKKNESGITETDKRGRHIPSNKTNDAVIQSVVDHISSYPSYESHYTREKSKRRYLGPELNIALMYKQYKDKMIEAGKDVGERAKDWLYREIFNTKFNLSFKLPDVDTCDDCDKYKRLLKDENDEDNKKRILKDKEYHLEKAQIRYSLKAEDKLKSYNDSSKRVLFLDLQKCLPTPSLTNTQSFYLRKLWTLNLVIYDATTKTTENFVWPENIAGRGGNEIASCILLWCLKYLTDSPIEEITIWTDNCAGQNRNFMVVACYLLIFFMFPNIKCINHKFLLKGHTHMEVDHVHSMIERKKKRLTSMEIVIPHDWAQFIKTCGGRNPFNVNEMEMSSFKDFTQIYKRSGPLVQRKKNVKGKEFKISESVWWQFRREKLGSLFYKNDFTHGEFEEIILKRNLKKSDLYISTELPNVRQVGKPISSAKYRDLQTLTAWIPEQFHEYYKKLPHQEEANDFPDNTEDISELV